MSTRSPAQREPSPELERAAIDLVQRVSSSVYKTGTTREAIEIAKKALDDFAAKALKDERREREKYRVPGPTQARCQCPGLYQDPHRPGCPEAARVEPERGEP